MMFAMGVVLFAVGITLSVALHECGHMWAARATGMKVRRYFVGFGPTVFSFRRGETEYGLKAIPLGGFCDIAGMTAMDEVAPEDLDRAMYRQATWKRLVVMSGGIAMNFLLGFLLIVLAAVVWGLPNRTEPPARIDGLSCIASENPDGTMRECRGSGPAQAGGLQPGDVVTAVNGVPVRTWLEFQRQTQQQEGVIRYTIDRDGSEVVREVVPERVTRYRDGVARQVSAVGVSIDHDYVIDYNLVTAVPGAAAFTGDMAVSTVHALVQMPAKVAALWDAVTGGERDLDTPVSVVGASVIGGQTAERGLWDWFVVLLASLNLFLGAFNLLPLLPLDGGHMAVVLYEKVRNTVRGWRGLAPGSPVDYLKLLPMTYAAVALGGAYMLLTLTADIVNPIKLFP
ncbi:M50 family metallopeptidase [Nocardia sp. NPDC127579]|uniref:M50 family metallopeptidase n=1 Tax=Nocardia sp. NPDC127579 TaxID=3345402 RepID=UPI003640E988